MLGRPCPLGLFPHYELRTDLAGWVVPSKLGLQRWITAAAAVASLDRPQSHPRRRNPSPDAGNCSLGDAHQRPPSRHQRQLLGGREEGGPLLIIPMYFNCICGRTFKGRCDHHGVKSTGGPPPLSRLGRLAESPYFQPHVKQGPRGLQEGREVLKDKSKLGEEPKEEIGQF